MGHWIRDHIENLNRTVNSWGKVGGMGRGKVFGRLGVLGGLLVLRPALDHCATWKLFLVGPYFWPHESVFFLCSDLDSTLSCQVIRILCLQLLCPSGARLKKKQTAILFPVLQRKLVGGRTDLQDVSLIKIWSVFGLSSRHLTSQALHKEPKNRLLDLYFRKCLKEVIQCWQTVTSSISQRTEIQKGM